MILDNIEYEHLSGFVIPAYSYEEGDKNEQFWVDSQNCLFYFLDDEPDDGPAGIMKDGKKHWMMDPIKPVGIKITEDNIDLVRWIVTIGPDEDMEKEWDFDNHRVKDK